MRAALGGLAAALVVVCAPLAVGAQEAAPEPRPAETGTPQAEGPRPADAPPKPMTLDQLLERVKSRVATEQEEDLHREEDFEQAQERQAEMLAKVEQALARANARSQTLETRYNDNQDHIAAHQDRLSERLGQLGELFGVVRQVATDLREQIWDSLTSSELGPRSELLERLGRSQGVPSTEDLRKLWFELQREMTEQGTVDRYAAPVLEPDGERRKAEVVRAGPFTAIADGRYLLWDPAEQVLREPARQPPAHYLETIASFQRGGPGFHRLAVDPTRGSLLDALTYTPSFVERIQQGGYVGYVIILLGGVAVILGLASGVMISVTSRKVAAQQERDAPDPDNPLGRVLAVYDKNRNADPETLELKLDEAVLRESSHLTRFLWIVKAASLITPLLGLLGTVTGMIQTFQMITLYGAGDPKLMADGISEALVTTMLGLVAAIPLVLLYAALSTRTSRITDVLSGASTDLLAARWEQMRA